MKRTRRCPKCKSKRIGYIATVMDDTGRGERPRRLAETQKGGFLHLGPSTVHAAEVEAYVCTDCGFFEEYVKEPKAVEWDKLEAFERVRPFSEREPGE